jgi:hypothetical protein
MPKTNLEKTIAIGADAFALWIVNAVKGATLQELIELQSSVMPKTGDRKPRRKHARKPGPKPGVKRAKPGPKRGAKSAHGRKVVKKATTKKKRMVKNYPKCAYPGCGKNRFVRGKGFCGDHWRMWVAGKIKSADNYKK